MVQEKGIWAHEDRQQWAIFQQTYAVANKTIDNQPCQEESSDFFPPAMNTS